MQYYNGLIHSLNTTIFHTPYSKKDFFPLKYGISYPQNMLTLCIYIQKAAKICL